MTDSRTVHLTLNKRQAQMLHTLCHNERKKRQRAYERSDFKPAPGRYNADLFRVEVMDDLLRQLDRTDRYHTSGSRSVLLRNGEVALIQRALRMYMAQYQRMVGEEKDPKHKENLRGYITAAEALFYRLHPAHAKSPEESP